MNKADKEILKDIHYLPLTIMVTTGLIYIFSYILGLEYYTFGIIYASLGAVIYFAIEIKVKPGSILRLIKWSRSF